MTENLSVASLSIGRKPARQEYGISQVSDTVRDVISRITHFTTDRHHRLVFKVIASEDAHRVKRLERQILLLATHCIRKIECQHVGLEIGRASCRERGE